METTMTQYEQSAAEASRLLEARGEHSCDSSLIQEFFKCTTLLATDERRTSVPKVLEFVDARERLMLTPEEVAGAIEVLVSKGLVEYEAQSLVVPESVWKRLPRKRGKIDSSAASAFQWKALLENQP
jgi:hypothetical protein